VHQLPGAMNPVDTAVKVRSGTNALDILMDRESNGKPKPFLVRDYRGWWDLPPRSIRPSPVMGYLLLGIVLVEIAAALILWPYINKIG
jgi:hypothetical protein